MRVIKKYDNRSLYDNEISSNIALDDLKKYVLSGIKFKIINAKTEEDITRQYLIQIILDLEVLGTPLFSQESLEQMIRFYSSPQQKWLQDYIHQTFTVMSKQQQIIADVWLNTGK